MAGFSWADALDKIAVEFPDTKFAIIDMVVDKPNVRSVVYKEQEGSYLVGVMAAMASKSKKVGFIGGNGHSADPQIRLRLCRRRQVGGCDRSHPET